MTRDMRDTFNGLGTCSFILGCGCLSATFVCVAAYNLAEAPMSDVSQNVLALGLWSGIVGLGLVSTGGLCTSILGLMRHKPT